MNGEPTTQGWYWWWSYAYERWEPVSVGYLERKPRTLQARSFWLSTNDLVGYRPIAILTELGIWGQRFREPAPAQAGG